MAGRHVPYLVNGADVGIVQRGSSARLAADAFESLGIVKQIVRQEFQCDQSAEMRVFGFEDHTRPAASEHTSALQIPLRRMTPAHRSAANGQHRTRCVRNHFVGSGWQMS
jgi:hypothetical protein